MASVIEFNGIYIKKPLKDKINIQTQQKVMS